MAELLTQADLLSKKEYEATREQVRREIMVQKRSRRILIGTNCSVHFENRDIMRYQILEMLRCENTYENEEAIADELHAYNPLITQPDTLCATFMFEYPTEAERNSELTKLVGIDQHVWLQVADQPRIAGLFDQAQMNDKKVSSVQFVKFPLTKVEQQLIATSGTVVRVIIDHPSYLAQSVLGEETRQSIAKDLMA